jgi:hypothetical protein
LLVVATGAFAVLSWPATPARGLQGLPPTAGWQTVVGRCIPCHSLEIAVQQRQSRTGWAEILDRMISYGAPIPPDEREAILTYLAREFSETTPR